VRAAIALAPDDWEYYMRLAQLDLIHARELLTVAQSLDRYNAQADIELGLQYEAEGDFSRAEKQMLEAYEVDHTYLPRWSLANYYFRRNNMPAFWAWARSAAEMPADDVGPLFELCWRVSPDPEKISAAILNDNPELIRQYLGFLLAKDQLQAAATIAPRLLRTGDADDDRALLLAVVNRLVAGNDVAADRLWRLLIAGRWVVADTTVPNNADFAREPQPVSFDWALPEYAGLHSWPGPSGLETEFTGEEPEDCMIAEQILALPPGNYSLAYAYRTEEIPRGTGIRWQVVDLKSNTVLADSSDLSSDALVNSSMMFPVPPNTPLLRLRLAYRRALGTPRISGMLVIRSTEIQVNPS
jgi:tetratricopeptide (TPR) repeat protein